MESNFDHLFITLPSDFKLDQNYILDTQTGIRRIFQNVKFTDEELKQISSLKEYMKTNKLNGLLDFEFNDKKYWEDS